MASSCVQIWLNNKWSGSGWGSCVLSGEWKWIHLHELLRREHVQRLWEVRKMNDRLGRADIHGSSGKIHVISSRGRDANAIMCTRNSNIIIWV